jgi:methyltransferase
LVPVWYLTLVGLAAVDRLAEMAYSRFNQRRMSQRGARKVHDPVFAGMVALHIGYLCAAPLEVWVLDRTFLPWLGFPAMAIFAAANALRVWAIRALSVHWNMQIVASQSLGAVETGPYRWIRHPNYVAVFFEVASLPLIHTAWLTASVATFAQVVLLRRRIDAEEQVLMKDPDYRARMGGKPRFFPGLWLMRS